MPKEFARLSALILANRAQVTKCDLSNEKLYESGMQHANLLSWLWLELQLVKQSRRHSHCRHERRYGGKKTFSLWVYRSGSTDHR